MKRLLLINHEESRTGAPKVILDIGKYLEGAYEIAVVSLRKGSRHKEFNEAFGTVIYPDDSEDRNAIGRSLAVLRPDLVYANSFESWTFAYVARTMGIPSIFHIHEMLRRQVYKGSPTNPLPSMDEIADVFIGPSELIYAPLMENGVDSSKIVVIPEFVSSREILAYAKESQDDMDSVVRQGTVVVVGVGHGFHRKGIDLFKGAAEFVKENANKEFTFIWVGDIPAKSDAVVILGEKGNPFPYMAASNIFVLSSRSDAFPLVCLAAMTLGKPIVAFKDSGAMPTIIKDRCGIVVDQMDAISLGRAVLYLAARQDLIESFAKQGPMIQRAKYEAEVVLPRIHDLIEHVLSKSANS